MSQLKFYKYATLGLLVLNALLIAFFFLTKPGPGRGHVPGDLEKRAINHLGLDEAQHEGFLTSAGRHQKQMPIIEEQQKELLQKYFQTLVDSSSTLDLQNTLEQLTELEKQKIELTYQHFKEIKVLLAPHQIKKFEDFMKDILRRLLPPKRKKRH